MLQDPRVLVLAERGDGYELRDGIDRLPLEVVLEIDGPLCVAETVISRFPVSDWEGEGFLACLFLAGLAGQGRPDEPGVSILRSRGLTHPRSRQLGLWIIGNFFVLRELQSGHPASAPWEQPRELLFNFQ